MSPRAELKPRQCRKCGCTDGQACVEFDGKGRGFGCYWVSADLCSACCFKEHVSAPEADERPLKPFVVAPQLAGYVARPR